MDNKFLYIINYPQYERDLCFLEMRCLFNTEIKDEVFLSDVEINPSHSTFIKSRLDILYVEGSIEKVLEELSRGNLAYEGFKVEYIRSLKSDLAYEDRLKTLKEIGLRITGTPKMRDPDIRIALGFHKGRWYLGILAENDLSWNERKTKPLSYSNSMEVKMAKTVVNLASKGDLSKKLVDPCCGIATVVLEGLAMGYDIEGFEISPKNVYNSKYNLKHFGYEPRVSQADMTTLESHYDASIIDIPYGIFSHAPKELQQAILHSARRISDRLILITFENLDDLLENANFKILDQCFVTKGKFTRHILICE